MTIKLSIYFVVGLTLLVSYLLGCFNGSVVTSHFIIRDDVRKHGSGMPGLPISTAPMGPNLPSS